MGDERPAVEEVLEVSSEGGESQAPVNVVFLNAVNVGVEDQPVRIDQRFPGVLHRQVLAQQHHADFDNGVIVTHACRLEVDDRVTGVQTTAK